MSRNCIIIPARYDSTRFPGKLLQDLLGRSILQHVYTNCLKSELVSKVIIATDDERIAEHCRDHFMDYVMTKGSHNSGTDRIAEAISNMKGAFDCVINVQGDEPLVSSKEINSLINLMAAKRCDIGTLYRTGINRRINNPGEVKLTTNNKNKVLYFSRSTIPYQRDSKKAYAVKYHLGMYAFKPEILDAITNIGSSELETLEKLEQLRWLENDYSIFATEVDYKGIGIDTEQDLIEVRKLMSEPETENESE